MVSNAQSTKIFVSGEMVNELLRGETSLAKEIEKRTTNGETFDAKLTRLKREFEENFSKVLKSEYAQVG